MTGSGAGNATSSFLGLLFLGPIGCDVLCMMLAIACSDQDDPSGANPITRSRRWTQNFELTLSTPAPLPAQGSPSARGAVASRIGTRRP
jgi:hypothetical protein